MQDEKILKLIESGLYSLEIFFLAMMLELYFLNYPAEVVKKLPA